MARPTKYDQHTADVLLKAVTAGLPNKTAAALAGIDERTLYLWKRKGKAGEEPFLQFFQSLKASQAKAVEGAMKVIAAAALRGEWRAAAWWLERRHADEFGSERKRIREIEKTLAELNRNGSCAPNLPLTDEQRVAGLTGLLSRMGLVIVPADSVKHPPTPPAAIGG